jgi:DnaJ-class molecular chaperone
MYPQYKNNMTTENVLKECVFGHKKSIAMIYLDKYQKCTGNKSKNRLVGLH